MKRKKKVYFKKIAVLFFILIFLSTTYLIWAYFQNQSLMNRGNQLLKEGKTTEAIILFSQASRLFPFNKDAAGSLQGAKLVLQSTQDFNQINEFDAEIENAELQNIPSLNALQPSSLKPNEIFVPVLMYHHIWINPRPNDSLWASLSITPVQLNEQFNYLATHNYHPITLSQLFDSFIGKFTLPSNPVVLSFDDGYANFYTEAFPLLKKYQFVAVAFVITNVETYPAYMTWNQIIQLDRSGLVEIAAHTQNHPDLTRISVSLQTREIMGSKTDIELHLNKKVNFFAYPYGSYNDSVIQLVKQAGFRGAASTIYGSNQSLENGFLLPRIMVDGRFSISEFARRISM